VAEEYQCDHLEKILNEISTFFEPFVVQTTRLALFTGESPIVYVPIVRTEILSQIHAMIWGRVTPISICPNQYYSPELSIPQITLAVTGLPTKAAVHIRETCLSSFQLEYKG